MPTVPVSVGPCEWPVETCHEPDECGACASLVGVGDAEQAMLAEVAAEFLWRWTGRRFGLCEVTVRPCRTDCDEDARGVWRPYRRGGEWFNCRGVCRGDRCSCSEVCEVVLPGPVHDVTEVLVDGFPLLDVEYRVDNHRRLVRVPWQTRRYTTPESQTGQNRYDYPRDGMWTAFFAGWGNGVGNPPIPTSEGGPGGDLGQVNWPGPAAGARGQFIRLWVPPLSVVSIDTPERGVTIWRTNEPDANGVFDDAAGTYSGGSEGTEYVVRFDGDQSVSFTTEAAGVEVREVGWMVPGGGECWPTCQEMARPADVPVDRTGLAAGTWSVTYRQGVEVPAGGRYAAGVLACELAKACRNDGTCKLPQRVQTVTRQGVTMALLDEQAGVDGRTGLYPVDSWVASVLEPRRTMGAAVFSPDRLPSHRSTTWSQP